MPKRFIKQHNKVLAALARKSERQEAKEAKQQREANATKDVKWRENDKRITKKFQRKQELERKRRKHLENKAEIKALLEKEMSSIEETIVKQPVAKLTRAQIQAEAEKQKAASEEMRSQPKFHFVPLEENPNRLQHDETATTIEEAIHILTINKNLSEDKHPEKRLKAAYFAFEENNLPILKEENPNFRLSKLKEMLFKEWEKSQRKF